MSARVTVQKWKVRGRTKWAVHRVESGKRKRTFFDSKKSADAEASTLRSQRTVAGDIWLTLSASERQRLLQVHYEAKQAGVDLADLLADWKRSPRFVGSSPPLERVITELAAAKLAGGRSPGYTNGLSNVLTQFAKGRERIPIAKVGLPDVEAFLNSKNIHSRQTLRARLSALFKFAVRRGYRMDNPCDRLESVKVVRNSPTIFTVEQAQKCLTFLDTKRCRALGWFVLTTFAGLRPEEAEKTAWEQVSFDEGWIRIEAQTSKVRQRRCKRRLKSAAGGARKVRHLPVQRELVWSGWVKPSMGGAAR